MRLTLIAAVGLLALAAPAFDSDAWLARRGTFEREAERLRGAYSNYLAQVERPATDVRIPLELHENGTVKSLVIAKKAQYFLDKGVLWGQGVTVEQYRKDGSLEMRVDAENCLADRTAKLCWMEGHVKAVHKRTTLEGDGAFYSSKDEYLKIDRNAVIVSEDVKMKGFKL